MNGVAAKNLELLRTRYPQIPRRYEAGTPVARPCQDLDRLFRLVEKSDAVMVCGAGSGAEIVEVFGRTKLDYFTKQRPLYIVLQNLDQARALLEHPDAAPLFESPRVEFFFRDHDANFLHGYFCNEHPARPLPVSVICLSGDDAFYRSVCVEVQRCHNERSGRIAVLRERLAAVYADYDDTRLCAPAAEGRALPLKILAFTSRFTAFVQYCTRDCAEAFESMGHTVRVWAEPTDLDRLNGYVLLREIDEFRPDVVFSIDHTRHEYPGLYPEKLPFITWVQDELPELYDPQTAARICARDFVFSSGYRNPLITRGYWAAQTYGFMECTNSTRYFPRVLTDAQRARYGCEVSFVSHASSSPEEELLRLKREALGAGSGPDFIRLIERIYRRVEENNLAGDAFYSKAPYEAIIEESARQLEYGLDDGVRNFLLNRFYHVVGNRFFRQLPLEWAAGKGVDVKLWGAGWEKHPRLARYAAGVARNGEELNVIFNASRVNLQLSHHEDIIHPRLLDCISAGGTMLVRTDLDVSWRHRFLYHCFCFNTREDFFERLNFLLDERNTEQVRARARRFSERVAESYSYRRGMRCMLEMAALRVWMERRGLMAEFLRDKDLCAESRAALRQAYDRLTQQSFVREQLWMMLRALAFDTSAAAEVTAYPSAQEQAEEEEIDRARLAEVCRLFEAGEFQTARGALETLLPVAPTCYAPVIYALAGEICRRLNDDIGSVRYRNKCVRFGTHLSRDELVSLGLGSGSAQAVEAFAKG